MELEEGNGAEYGCRVNVENVFVSRRALGKRYRDDESSNSKNLDSAVVL